MSPLPESFHKRLNTDQLLALRLVENYGWGMKFVRRPPNQKPTFVIFNNSTHQYAVLDEDGTLNIETGIKIRN
ncbi:MAG TPA: hypothetical protein ENG90_07240 [Gammaproteobacteria bacterium]|nr:hypothetical protein [Gammaproteobacteria bacterium]